MLCPQSSIPPQPAGSDAFRLRLLELQHWRDLTIPTSLPPDKFSELIFSCFFLHLYRTSSPASSECHRSSQPVKFVGSATGLETPTSVVIVMLTNCKQMMYGRRWQNLARLSAQKTPGKSNITVFSTLAGTLCVYQRGAPRPLPLLNLLLGHPS